MDVNNASASDSNKENINVINYCLWRYWCLLMLKDDKYLLQNTGKSDCKNSMAKEQYCNDMWIIFPFY